MQREGAGFTRVMLGGNVAVLLLFLINAVFRGAGDAAIAMRSLWIASACNMILGPLFIFGVGPFPHLGLTGAAVGTTIGRSIGVLYQFSQLLRRDGRIVIRAPHIKLDPLLMGHLMRLSGSGTFQILIGTASWVGLVRVVSGFGSSVLAGYTIRFPRHHLRAAALVGAEQRRRHPWWARISARRNPTVRRRRSDGGVLQHDGCWESSACCSCWRRGRSSASSRTIRRSSPGVSLPAHRQPGVPVLRLGHGPVQFLQWRRRYWTPTWLNLCCFWLFELPLAWILSRQEGIGPVGVFIAITIAFSAFAVASAWLFKRGRWKSRAV